jgi:hypothetical protein
VPQFFREHRKNCGTFKPGTIQAALLGSMFPVLHYAMSNHRVGVMAGGEGVVTGGGVSAGATTPERFGWLGPRIKNAATSTMTTIKSRPIIPFFVMGPSSRWLATYRVRICKFI